MRDVIDAKFEVIEGPAKAPPGPPDPRWLFYIIRMALGLVAIGAVVAASLESPPSDRSAPAQAKQPAQPSQPDPDVAAHLAATERHRVSPLGPPPKRPEP